MSQSSNQQFDIDRELESLDQAIIDSNTKTAQLMERRCEVIARKEDLQLQDVIEIALSRGILPCELLDAVEKIKLYS